MSDHSAIEWTNASWNPVTGCTKLSAGCDHCYAERFAERFRGVPGHPFEPGFDLTPRPERLDQPERWRRSRLIFVNSMSDLFHKNIGADFIGKVFDTMESADWHTYQVLTKRSSLMRNYVNKRYTGKSAPSHVWLGVSIENKKALSRLRHLQDTRATVRFVSFEPLLGPIGDVDLSGIHWVIAGGESGPGARPVEEDWLREIRDQCQAQGVAFFFKQWGGRTPKAGGNMLDGRQWLEYPTVGGHDDQWWSENRRMAAGAPVEKSPMEVGPWAREKLACLRKYLEAYTMILRKQSWCQGYFYIDAFAGPGLLQVRREQRDPDQLLLDVAGYANDDAGAKEYIAGSPHVALDIKHPFTNYFFIERDAARQRKLRELAKRFSEARVDVRNVDCNEFLSGLVENGTKWLRKRRGVVFLDPFGMQVPWDTVEALGRTGVIEIFVNFPLMAIQRLLKRNGDFTSQQRQKLDTYFGTDAWFEVLYRSESDLLGTHVVKEQKSADRLIKWYRSRLKEAFGHVSAAREVQSQTGHPLYYLIFAGPNETGARISDKVLRQGARVVR